MGTHDALRLLPPAGDRARTRTEAPSPVLHFLAFAFAYFFSALLRAVTATLAPLFSLELSLGAAELGLLAGAFFFGFAAIQLPLGWALDRYGPRLTLLVLLAIAVSGCFAFSVARELPALLAARALMGAGLGACLMSALTSYRRWFSPVAQLRANSWMLMTGSLGMVASTLPVQALLPVVGWRGLFGLLGVLLLLAMALLALLVPHDDPAHSTAFRNRQGYGAIVRHPLFLATAPLGFFAYGGLIAMQSLWAGPWLTHVSGWSAGEAAHGLFAINVSMLVAFMLWGAVMPKFSAKGWPAERLMAWGLPISMVVLFCIVLLGSQVSAWHWALWCTASTFVSLSQPAVGAVFASQQAGRALSAFNLVIFSGVFVVQWGLGLLIDGLQLWGLDVTASFRWGVAVYGLCCVVAYAWFLWRRIWLHNVRDEVFSSMSSAHSRTADSATGCRASSPAPKP
jgi:predicted MFS family arabinose efflux permease